MSNTLTTTMSIAFHGILMGIIATLVMDVWAMIVKYVFRLPTTNWALVGRWFGHMSRRKLVHRPIASSAEIANEMAIGWIAHYIIGIIYGLVYLAIVLGYFGVAPSIGSAVLFGLVTIIAPWIIMQPCLGIGFFASNAPQPNMMRLLNLSMHTIFGASLYLAWLGIT